MPTINNHNTIITNKAKNQPAKSTNNQNKTKPKSNPNKTKPYYNPKQTAATIPLKHNIQQTKQASPHKR